MAFDKERRLNELFADFKRTDAFYTVFKKEFNEIIIDTILDFHPTFKQKDVLNDIIELYATETLSAIESVIDKDNNYPEYRKNEELAYMDRLINKEQVILKEDEFLASLHKNIKALVVKHYPNIINLSTHGFKLLERNLKLYLYEFIAQFIPFTK